MELTLCGGILVGLSFGTMIDWRSIFQRRRSGSRSRSRSAPHHPDPNAPPRPCHHVLRPETDPRTDEALIVRYNPTSSKKTGAIIIVIPGGNYEESDIAGGEGQPIAQWLVNCGITALVLQYRCISRGHYWPAQFEDWIDCAELVQKQAESWGCDPHRVGVMGFSAGGHLASYAAAMAEENLRPRLQVLVYPAIDTLSPHDGAEMDPWDATKGYPPPEASTHLLVDNRVPPTFLVGLTKDKCTPIHENSDVYASVLGDKQVPVEYVKGEEDDHGCGLQEWWTSPCEDWLRSHGWCCAA